MSKVYKIVTRKILDRLNQGVVPWKKTWQHGLPKNLVSGKTYRGVNLLLLADVDYDKPYFVTFNQAKDLGGSIKKGAKSHLVVFWKMIRTKEQLTDRNGSPLYDESGNPRFRIQPLLRYYRVFNVADTEGLDDKIPPDLNPEFSPHEKAEKIVQSYIDKPEIKLAGGSAYYSPAHDRVTVPRPGSFESESYFYGTLFHELVHSTGHKSRLARPGVTGVAAFGSDRYSKEELVAELGSTFLCAEAGFENKTIDNSTAYIKGWAERISHDDKLIVYASSQAQKAAEYILKGKAGRYEQTDC